ncbi:hypothetical protein D6789_04895, partial [Candidatus Woesearchaeota archaeon]
MRIIHEHNGERREGEGRGLGAGMFLLTNKKGTWLSLAPENITKYNGLIHYDAVADTYVKTIADFVLATKPRTIINRVSSVERQHDHARETFWMSSTALHYHLENYTGPLILDLDTRRLDDESTDGRSYHLEQEGDVLLIHYEKRGGPRGTYAYWVACKGLSTHERIDRWEERHFPYDEQRGDASTFWVYRACALPIHGRARLVITRSATREKALAKVERAWTEEEEIVESLEHAAQRRYQTGSLIRDLALAALDALTTKRKGSFTGIYAGLPWFHQFWSRDELISAAPLITTEQYSLMKELLVRYYERLDTPLEAQYPSGGLRAVDALGWLAIRTHELLAKLEAQGILADYFTRLELAYLRDRLQFALRERFRTQLRDGLIVSGPGETWMDAQWGGDDRAGACIEIQAQTLRALKLAQFLEQKTRLFPSSEWRKREKALHERVRGVFFRGGVLADRAGDPTQRPNVFLAYSAYPQLLSREEWRGVFDAALPSLFLEWGGLASIATTHPLFTTHYTGMNNKSYHRGDSWFWVNCLAAQSLHRIAPEHYHETIARLMDAAVA